MGAVPLVNDMGICLRRLDYSETSQIVSLFTRRHGVMKAIAKGAKRTTKAGDSRFDGGLDVLDLGDAVFIHTPEKEMSTLTEWSLLEGHLGLRENLRAIHLGMYAAELVTMLIQEHDPHEEVFNDLADLAVMLSAGGGGGAEEAFLAFELRLLHASGLMPELGMCVSCGNALDERGTRAFFLPSRGGVLCRECELSGAFPTRLAVDVRLVRLCRTLSGMLLPGRYGTGGMRAVTGEIPALRGVRLPRLTRAQTDPINRMLLAHVREATSRDPRLSAYLFPAPAMRWPRRVAGRTGQVGAPASDTRVGEVTTLDSPPTHATDVPSRAEPVSSSAPDGATDGGTAEGSAKSSDPGGGALDGDGPDTQGVGATQPCDADAHGAGHSVAGHRVAR